MFYCTFGPISMECISLGHYLDFMFFTLAVHVAHTMKLPNFVLHIYVGDKFSISNFQLTVIKHFEMMDAKNGPNEMFENPLNFNWTFKFLNLKLLPIKFIFSFPMKLKSAAKKFNTKMSMASPAIII